MVTYNTIVRAFYNFSLNHKQINSFFSGNLDEYQSKTNLFPSMIVNSRPSYIGKNSVVLTFNVIFADIIKIDSSNVDEIKSDMLSVLGDFVKHLELSYVDFRITEDTNTITPFDESLDDRVAGWMVTFNIEYKTLGHCNIPYISDLIVPSDIPNEPPIVLTAFNFSTLVESLIPGENINFDISWPNKTITINSEGGGGSTFSYNDLIAMILPGENITFDYDLLDEKVYVNGLDPIPGPMGPTGPMGLTGNDGNDGINGATGATGPAGSDSPIYIRRSDYVTLVSYQGFALVGSLETDAAWTITKIITSVTGSVVSSTEFTNVKWSDRYIL